MSKCYFCGAGSSGKIYRTTICSSCGRELKVCKNCLHYDSSSYNQCREPQAERVADKERANFCDYFEPSGEGGSSTGSDKAKEARSKLEDLFS
ncbi:MAG: hypothetical protein PQJ50_03995 [Spirochaetales bacterium]|nr:hypothetical protein [Spirochaetales bacterium]